MLYFGIPEDVIELWYACHTSNILEFREIGIKIKTLFQRRSGDVCTFIGNTVVTMASLSHCYDLTNSHGGMFGGDDSLVLLNKNTEIYDQSKQIQ